MKSNLNVLGVIPARGGSKRLPRKNIKMLGGKTEYENNNLKIIPQKSYKGGTINTFNDHRIAMSFAIAGTKISDIIIDNPECVQKSYPDFWNDFTFWETK